MSGDPLEKNFWHSTSTRNCHFTTYYEQTQWITIAANCIGINASQFNTHRVMSDYLTKAYNKVFQEDYYLETNPQLVSVLESTMVI